MIGDQDFDVIILEFPLSNVDDFGTLLRRIRNRFPSATIIYLQIFLIALIVLYQGKSLHDHILSLGIKSPNEPRFVEAIRQMNEGDMQFPAPWYIDDAHHNAVKSVGGYVLQFPQFSGNIKEFILENVKYYGSAQRPLDFVHPSTLGHKVIAEKLNLAISEFSVRDQGHSISGQWTGGKDRCISWFSDGNVTSDVTMVENLNLVNIVSDNGGKWALEVDREGGKIAVMCTFPQCRIYLPYMAKGPKKDYPRVLASINDFEPVLVDPSILGNHVRQIAYLGTVNSGDVTLSIMSVPEDVNSTLMFRFTGIIMTPTLY